MKKQNKPEEELKKESVKRMKTLGKVYKQGFKQGQAEAEKKFLEIIEDINFSEELYQSAYLNKKKRELDLNFGVRDIIKKKINKLEKQK